jgi:hypothetical protein
MTTLVNEELYHQYRIVEGLDFILSHFREDNLFPRKISTKLTAGKQILVYNKFEALARFKQADFMDCKIAAYHATDWRKGLSKLIEPNFLFIDLDLQVIGTIELLETALNDTLENIKSKLGGYPTVLWSGNGYHLYQPVSALILEEQDTFSKFEQPSRRLIQYAERYLSNGKMDQCHNSTMSLNNCMLRIPHSYNSKSEPPKEVRKIQRWNGNRPDVRPLLYGCYIYMQDLRLKILKQKKQNQHSHSGGRKFCPYWLRRKC